MRLHVQARLAGVQLAGQLQLQGAAGRGKAWRHRVMQAATAVPARGQRGAVGHALFGAVAQIVRGVAVHQHLATDQPHIAALGLGHQRVHRHRVHGGKDGRGGGAVRQQAVQHEGGGAPRQLRVAKRRFRRKGVVAQPVQQLAAKRADHPGLGVMQVAVDQAGQNQLAAMVVHRYAGQRRRVAGSPVAAGSHAAVLQVEVAVSPVLPAGVVVGGAGVIQKVQHFAAQDQGVHRVILVTACAPARCDGPAAAAARGR
ncbi:hypothetical protein QF022_000193 [Vogesella perlucida]|nr:hypothetical protein [Vogesella perlucida]